MDLEETQITSINSRAQSRFTEIKNRMKLNLFRDTVLSESYPQRDVDHKRIQELLNHPEQNDKFEVKDETVQKKIEQNRAVVDDIFEKIKTLGLTNELALAVGLIVSAHQTERYKAIDQAIAILDIYRFEKDKTNGGKEKENNS